MEKKGRNRERLRGRKGRNLEKRFRIHLLTTRTPLNIILTRGSFPQRKPEVFLHSGL